MADTKISALTSATTPLAGTEVLPIVQSGATVKVANNDLRPKQIQSNATSGVLQVAGPAAAATRVMTTPDANFTVARTDVGQTFTGNQIVNGNVYVNTTGTTGSLNGDVINLFGSGTVRNIVQTTGQYAVVNIGSGGTSATPTTTAYYFTDATGNVAYFGTGTNTPINVVVNGSTVFAFNTSENLVVGTAGKGIDFSANTGAAGMTSELLNWYEEGTFTPTLAAGSGTITSYTSSGRYTRVGRLITVESRVTITNNGTGATGLIVGAFPYAAPATSSLSGACREDAAAGFGIVGSGYSTTSIYLTKTDGTYPGGTNHAFTIIVTYSV